MDVALVYAGLLTLLLGLASLVRPLRLLRLRTRAGGALVLLSGLALVLLGTYVVGYGPKRAGGPPSRIDDFAAEYHFGELHSLRVKAPPGRVFRAIREVTPREIRFFLLLTGIRSLNPARILGRGQPPAGASKPILEIATRSGFMCLAEDEDRELVIGTVGQFWKLTGGRHPVIADPAAFQAFAEPGYAKAVMNFRIQDQGDGYCLVTTETRVLATHPGARRKFAFYWRVIYPGSAIIRRMWLEAVRRRAEGSRFP